MDPNITNVTAIPVLGQLAGPISTFFKALSLLVGGIFGAYVLFALFNYLKKGKEVKILKEIKEELIKLNEKVEKIEKKLSKKK